MPPILLILWLVFAAAAALVTPKAHALDGTVVKPLEMLGTTYEQVHVRTPALTAVTPGGIRVARQADALIRASAARSIKLPLEARAVLTKPRVAAAAAAICIAFPAKCVGQLALGLATGWAFDQALGYILRPAPSISVGNCQGPAGGAIYSEAKGLCEARLGTNQKCGGNAPIWGHESGTHGAVAGDGDFRYCVENAASPGFCGYSGTCFLGRFSSTSAQSGGPPRQATPQEITDSFATKSATWQDSSFAEVFKDAVTKGATWPITTFDGAEMVAGPADAVATETQTINSPAGAVTRTTTTTATAVTSGTTIADAKAVITQRTTTTETGPAGTTTTQTETAPELENAVTLQPNSGTVTPAPEVTVNVEFPEPVFSDTALPEVPDLYEQKYPNGLAGVWAEKSPQLMATTFVTSVKAMFPTLSDSGACPSWVIDLNFGSMGNFGSGDVSPPCWLWGVISLIFLTSACFTAWRIIFG